MFRKGNIAAFVISLFIFGSSLMLMWNTAIAADEQTTVNVFLSEYNYLYWLFIFASLALVFIHICLLCKAKHK